MKRTLISAAVLAAALVAPAVNAEDMPGEQAQPVASADVPDEQVQALEKRLAELEAAGAATPAADSGVAGKLKINGFMSAGFGLADVEGFTYDNGLYDQVSHKADSIVGLQVEGQVNDKTSAVMQLVARGEDDFAVDAEWAYVAYRPTAVDEFRAGRMRATFYMMSEYLEVGYSYPWARPPAEVYRSDFPSSFDGLSWLHKFTAGSWQHDVKINWGSTNTQSDAVSQLDVEDAWALGITSTHGDWQFGANLNGAKLTAGNDLFDALAMLGMLDPVDRVDVAYRSLGAQYDNGSLLVIAEATQVEIEGVIPDTDSAYMTVGYRFGKVMPHLTYASIRIADEEERGDIAYLASQDDLFGNADGLPDLCPLGDPNPNASLCLAIIPNPGLPLPPPGTTVGIPFPADTLSRMLETEQDSVTLGVRYDFLPNATVKFDWTRVLDMHDTFGLLSAPDGNLFYDSTGALLAKPDEEIDIFRVAVDVVF